MCFFVVLDLCHLFVKVNRGYDRNLKIYFQRCVDQCDFQKFMTQQIFGEEGLCPPPQPYFLGGLEPKPHGVGDTGLFQTIQASVKIIDVITVIAESLLVEAYKFLLILLYTKKQ